MKDGAGVAIFACDEQIFRVGQRGRDIFFRRAPAFETGGEIARGILKRPRGDDDVRLVVRLLLRRCARGEGQ